MCGAVVTGRGRNPGGAGLNENTTRLVVCIPVLASPSCCNPIFFSTYARIYFLFARIKNSPSAPRRHAGEEQSRRAGVHGAFTALPSGTQPTPLSLFPPSVPGHRVSCREGLRAMSIDTLLEAARYLEWQAQQQQITRGEFKSRLLHCAERA